MLDVTQAAQPRPLPDMTWDERRDLGLFRVLRTLPVAAVSRIGATLGQLLGRRGHPAAAARVAMALRHLLPDLALDARQLENAQRRLWANVGRVYAEFCVLDRIVAEDRVSIRDPKALDVVLADGRPIIIAYVHLGNWEAIGMHLSRYIPDRMCAFAITPANRVQAQIAAMQRARFPGKVFAVDGMAWRHALEHLRQPGGILYVSVDEDDESGMPFPRSGAGSTCTATSAKSCVSPGAQAPLSCQDSANDFLARDFASIFLSRWNSREAPPTVRRKSCAGCNSSMHCLRRSCCA
jgi:hypothetical protein